MVAAAITMVSNPLWADAPPRFLEVLVRYDEGTLTVVEQWVREGRVPGPRATAAEWILEAQAADGQTLYRVALPDPRHYIRHQVDPDRGPLDMHGEAAVAREAAILVRIPYDARITQLRFSAVERTSDTMPHATGIGGTVPDATGRSAGATEIGTVAITLP